jgi:hypothetical protein
MALFVRTTSFQYVSRRFARSAMRWMAYAPPHAPASDPMNADMTAAPKFDPPSQRAYVFQVARG